ncbi:MAG: hypothetical protein ISR87_09870 [Candidatus Marinimicrobia bacterium]|nr:hypothetical protein [FCB group bacterium]MBL7025753.1 hypothetical protein [Candidatus Neomarinimicrobiota bacterium]
MLALDFDGVIADSIDECMVTAYNAFTHANWDYEPRKDLSGFSDLEIGEFRNLRPLIRRGEDYVFLLLAMSEKRQFLTQAKFDGFLDNNEIHREEYRRLFYAERERLQTQNPESWLNLNPLYPGMASFLKSRDVGEIFIVTTKDLVSVRLILEHNGIALRSDQMFQAVKTLRKPEILNSIQTKRGVEREQVHFIDDHVGTILEAKQDSSARVYCATWGYNTPEQLELLLHENIQALSLDEFLMKSW